MEEVKYKSTSDFFKNLFFTLFESFYELFRIYLGSVVINVAISWSLGLVGQHYFYIQGFWYQSDGLQLLMGLDFLFIAFVGLFYSLFLIIGNPVTLMGGLSILSYAILIFGLIFRKSKFGFLLISLSVSMLGIIGFEPMGV